MDFYQIKRDLETKLQNLEGAEAEAREGIESIENSLEELESAKSELEDFLNGDLDDRKDAYQNLIDAIDAFEQLDDSDLSVSVYVDSLDISIDVEG